MTKWKVKIILPTEVIVEADTEEEAELLALEQIYNLLCDPTESPILDIDEIE